MMIIILLIIYGIYEKGDRFWRQIGDTGYSAAWMDGGDRFQFSSSHFPRRPVWISAKKFSDFSSTSEDSSWVKFDAFPPAESACPSCLYRVCKKWASQKSRYIPMTRTQDTAGDEEIITDTSRVRFPWFCRIISQQQHDIFFTRISRNAICVHQYAWSDVDIAETETFFTIFRKYQSMPGYCIVITCATAACNEWPPYLCPQTNGLDLAWNCNLLPYPEERQTCLDLVPCPSNQTSQLMIEL